MAQMFIAGRRSYKQRTYSKGRVFFRRDLSTELLNVLQVNGPLWKPRAA